MGKPYDLVAVGNALVDVMAYTDEDFIRQQAASGMVRGSMNLIDRDRAAALYGQMGPASEMSGGSAANTLAGFASFGGSGAFIGKVADDDFGTVFRHDLQSQGLHYMAAPYTGHKEQTGRSYIFITPDGERTMNTYLGTNTLFGPRDVDADLVRNGKILLLEGYLYDRPAAKKAFNRAADIAGKNGTKVALTLSDHGCVERHFADFTKIVTNHVDILFANEKEIKAFTLKTDFDDAARDIAGCCEAAVLTRGAKGALILAGGQAHVIPPVSPEKLVDTTGAGDAFAAGVLYGMSRDMELAACGRLGAMAASATIAHTGARTVDTGFSRLLPRL